VTHRERMQKFRDARRAALLCLRCGSPVALRKNGTPAKSCQEHLDSDKSRKAEKREKLATL
jgi:hypothetical protein